MELTANLLLLLTTNKVRYMLVVSPGQRLLVPDRRLGGGITQPRSPVVGGAMVYGVVQPRPTTFTASSCRPRE